MQILVISDTHGKAGVLRDVILSHRSADLIVHCGDGAWELEQLLSEHDELAPRVVSVRGNCDFSMLVPLMEVVPLPFGHRLVAVHGHRYMMGDFRANLAALAKQQNADLVLFGHLHVRIDETYDGIRLFSPGSAAQSRDGKRPAFGLIDIFENGILTAHGDL